MIHDYQVMRHCVTAYLTEIASLIRSIDDAEARLASCQSKLELLGVDYSRKGTPGVSCVAHGDDAVSDGVTALQELREELATEIAHGIRDIEEARRLCSRDHPTRYALWLHHVQGMTWTKVARVLGYSEAHVRKRLAEAGVLELYTLMPERARRDFIPNAQT